MRRLAVPVAFAVILAVGLGLRLHAISPYMFYPDSYQSLVVAHNLQTAHRAVAAMGPGGLVYPDFVAWTRPGYSALIALGSALGLAPVTAARAINLLAGLGAVVVAYTLASRLLESRRAGLVAAGLLAISFGPVVWGGFVLTEALGVCLLLLVIWQLWRRRHQLPVTPGDPGDLATGLLLALATLTRYEYAVLILPAMLAAARPFSWLRAANILAAYAVVVATTFALIRPFPYGPAYALGQMGNIVLPGVIVLAGTVVVLAIIKILPRLRVPGPAWIPPGLLGLALILIPAARDVIAEDPLIMVGAAAGLAFMMRTIRYRALATYLLVSATLLAVIYTRTNPTMDRYWTHLIPFLVVPAAYAFASLWHRRLFVLLAVLMCVVQAAITLVGLRAESGNPWFRPGYEAVAAQRVDAVVPPGAMLVVAQPEPYYFVTGHPVQSITGEPPFLYLSPADKDRPLYIIQDQAMREIFPRFSEFLYEKFQDHKVAQFKVGTDFRYITQIEPEGKALTIYKASQSEITSATH